MEQFISTVLLTVLIYSTRCSTQKTGVKKIVCNHQSDVIRYRNSSNVFLDGLLYYGVNGNIIKSNVGYPKLVSKLDKNNIYIPTVTPKKDIVVYDKKPNKSSTCDEFFILRSSELNHFVPLIHVFGSRKGGVLAVLNMDTKYVMILYTKVKANMIYEVSNFLAARFGISILLISTK